MKKVALVYVLAVLVPSLVLAWLAVRSLRDQQFLLERQESLLYQGVVDGLARQVQDILAEDQHGFGQKVEALLQAQKPAELSRSFDELLRKDWPLAEVGFVVTLSGLICSPLPYSRPEAKTFVEDNGRFLANRESAEVYLNQKQVLNAPAVNPSSSLWQRSARSDLANNNYDSVGGNNAGGNKLEYRKVAPQQQNPAVAEQSAANEPQQQLSKFAPTAAEFRQLIGEEKEGTLARFVDNKLRVMFWYRAPSQPDLVFGAQLDLSRLSSNLQPLLEQIEPALRQELCLAVLDDSAKPVVVSPAGFQAAWKRPFVATELGETLPHWEVAAYLLNPARLAESARTLKITLGLLIAFLVFAIAAGSWLVGRDLNRELTLARQKTDFVSNVSHELKTPLTSIRMFAELLAEDRVSEPQKRRAYLEIITAEAGRLTRLINNVLDFSRMERNEKKYEFQSCDLGALARETGESWRPHVEAQGFKFDCRLPEQPILVNGDRDALAQVIVNLLSNAEKYSDSRKEITLEVSSRTGPLPYAELRVLDRGLGVPKGSEERIFEKFYRAHDSLSSGIQGSGLGLTLARQIARAHGGEIVCEPRAGGGSCFTLRLPLLPVQISATVSA